jgi:hypothetical protein
MYRCDSRSARQLLRFGVCALFLLAGVAANAVPEGTGCPASPLSSKTVPIAGLWQLDSYKEIHGNKSYAAAGDYVLIVPTDVPGEVCVEFTRFVEGNYYYYVAIDASGTSIDDNVVTDIGRNLRILIQSAGEGISMVLYTTVTGGGNHLEGGEEQSGGGAAGGGRI